MLIVVNYASILILTINKVIEFVKSKIKNSKQAKKHPTLAKVPNSRPRIKTESSCSSESERSVTSFRKKWNEKLSLNKISE